MTQSFELPSASEDDEELADALEELSSAEDFLSYFDVDYDPSVVHVNRLHILQRYHDYLSKAGNLVPEAGSAMRDVHRALLQRAYQDFVESNAVTEKVFKVFKEQAQKGFVGIDSLGGLTGPAQPKPSTNPSDG